LCLKFLFRSATILCSFCLREQPIWLDAKVESGRCHSIGRCQLFRSYKSVLGTLFLCSAAALDLARASSHARPSRTRIPIRRWESLVTIGPSSAAMRRLKVITEFLRFRPIRTVSRRDHQPKSARCGGRLVRVLCIESVGSNRAGPQGSTGPLSRYHGSIADDTTCRASGRILCASYRSDLDGQNLDRKGISAQEP